MALIEKCGLRRSPSEYPSKPDAVRMRGIAVIPVDAVGRDLDRAGTDEYLDSPVPQPRENNLAAVKAAERFIRLRRGRDIPVRRQSSELTVPDAASDEICVKPRFGQLFQRETGVIGNHAGDIRSSHRLHQTSEAFDIADRKVWSYPVISSEGAFSGVSARGDESEAGLYFSSKASERQKRSRRPTMPSTASFSSSRFIALPLIPRTTDMTKATGFL